MLQSGGITLTAQLTQDIDSTKAIGDADYSAKNSYLALRTLAEKLVYYIFILCEILNNAI